MGISKKYFLLHVSAPIGMCVQNFSFVALAVFEKQRSVSQYFESYIQYIDGVRIQMFRFADDIAIVAPDEFNLKRILECMNEILEEIKMKI